MVGEEFGGVWMKGKRIYFRGALMGGVAWLQKEGGEEMVVHDN